MKVKPVSKYRIAIGTPTTGFVRIEYTESLLAMQKELQADKRLGVQDMCLLYYCSSVIPDNRQKIVEMARKWEATHVLWIDDDMRWPPSAAKGLIHTMTQLAKLDKDNYPMILGANCIKRKYPIEYMATDFDGKTEVVSKDKRGMDPVLYTGNSFILVDMKVYDTVPQPWYAFPWNSAENRFGTEDVFFMDKARQFGLQTYVVHECGEMIDHVGIWTFKPNDSVSRRGHSGIPDWVLDGKGESEHSEAPG